MTLPFSTVELLQAIENGDVTARPHPTMPYKIYNYSPETQYRKWWNNVTLNCRGLILDENFNIIARPWKKFFNLGEVDLPIQFTDPVEVMDKADGSLGILYPVFHYDESGEMADVTWSVSTRGSFQSEQAEHATRVWNVKYGNTLMPMYGYTMLFEIVYPENRIVLNYDGMDDLILLGAVENETGYYHGPDTAKYFWQERGSREGTMWTGPVVEVFPYKNISEALGHMDRGNAEGYVIRSNNFMVKLKQPDYLELHRLVTNMTPKTIWEMLKSGKSVVEIVADLPDEFHLMAESIANPLVDNFTKRLEEILFSFGAAMAQIHTKFGFNASRKDIASVLTKSKDAKYFFSLLDNRPIHEVLWNELKPKETVLQED